MSQHTRERKTPNRARKRAANRERILRAARTVFGARGYHAATIEEIGDEAGLSNGAIYYNFQNKEDLFLALLEQRRDVRLEHARRAIEAGSPASGRELDGEAEDITRSFKESREWRLLLIEFVAYGARNPRFAVRLKEHKRELRAAVAEIIAQTLNARGTTPAVPIDQLAIAVTALVNGLAVEELSDPGAVPDELLGNLLALLLAAPTNDRSQ